MGIGFGSSYFYSDCGADSDGNNIDLTAKLFGEIAEKYKDRVGGYTQIIKVGARKGDNAEKVILKLV